MPLSPGSETTWVPALPGLSVGSDTA